MNEDQATEHARQGIAHLSARLTDLLDRQILSAGNVRWIATYFHALITAHGNPRGIQELRYRVMALAHQSMVEPSETTIAEHN